MQSFDVSLIAAAVSGALLSAGITSLIFRNKLNKQTAQTDQVQQRNDELQLATQRLQDNVVELTKDAAMVNELRVQRTQLQNQLNDLQHNHAKLFANHKAMQSGYAQKEQALQDKLHLLTQSEQRLSEQFENLASKILEKQSESFAQANEKGLDTLLKPLKEQIHAFNRQLTDQHIREGQERASLKTEILSLKALNQKITEEAAALTLALKGDNKQQGNWGEVVLERILEESGLRLGHEFETQVSLRSEDGKQRQPDVVVHLPNEKDVVIDSKVSLAAYERYFNTDDESIRQQSLKEHLQSLRAHIKGLSKKDYHTLPGIRTLDYVLMFVPIEPAFLLAVEAEPDLVNFALSKNIMLVSPTNLLVALRTINNIWQYEYQNQNAQKIAEHGAKLYDKFSNFIHDMEKIGKSLDITQKHFEGAVNKLSTGRHNIVRQVEQFKELGVQPSKQLPSSLLDSDDE
jgi:DNA recombination protein RmuC